MISQKPNMRYRGPLESVKFNHMNSSIQHDLKELDRLIKLRMVELYSVANVIFLGQEQEGLPRIVEEFTSGIPVVISVPDTYNAITLHRSLRRLKLACTTLRGDI